MHSKLIGLFFSVSFVVLITAGCSKKKASKADNVIPQLTPTPTIVDTPPPTATVTDSFGYTAGLPNFCSGVLKATDSYCVTCTPTDFPVERCITVTASFNPGIDCSHNTTEVRCKESDGEYYQIPLVNSIEERMLKFTPIMLTVINYLATKSTTTVESKPIIVALIQYLNTHNREIILGQNTATLVEGISQVVKTEYDKIHPTTPLTTEKVSELKTGTTGVLEFLNLARKKGTFDLTDGTTLLDKVKSMFSGVSDIQTFLSSLDLNALKLIFN